MTEEMRKAAEDYDKAHPVVRLPLEAQEFFEAVRFNDLQKGKTVSVSLCYLNFSIRLISPSSINELTQSTATNSSSSLNSNPTA
jgi:hypothetical protein